MKRISVICIIILMLVSLFGGAHCAALEIVPDELLFSSLEELLEAHKAVREGTADAELTELAEKVDFAELDELYVPTAIPKKYKLYNIRITQKFVEFLYLTENDMLSSEGLLDAQLYRREFWFRIGRCDYEYPTGNAMRQFQATEKDLICGVYLLFAPYNLTWGSDSKVMDLTIPRSLSNNKKNMVKFAAVDAVDIETGERTPYSPPVLYSGGDEWYNHMPSWLQWIFRHIFFGWIWMVPARVQWVLYYIFFGWIWM